MIRISHLSKTYGRRRVLTDITLEIAKRERVALVGPPGSGRTTLLRTVAALTAPSAGQVILDGVDTGQNPFAARRKVFLAGDGLHGAEMSVSEYLQLISGARGARPDHRGLDALATRAGLSPNARVSDMAGRDRRMLGLIAAVVSGADVLLLDELFDERNGVDREVSEPVLADARGRGATVIATGSTEAELDGICDRVVHLDAGRIRG